MAMDFRSEIDEPLYRAGLARLDFTRKAFQMLPKLERPRILDVGCGRGGPTLELAKMSGGEVIGLDIDQLSLDELSMRSAEEGLADRVSAMNRSMLEMDFHNESFDIIWAEASIQAVGFETALREWRALLRRGRFLVIHEMTWLRPDPPREIADYWRRIHPGIRTIPEYIDQVTLHGYHLIGSFALPDDFWWLGYYSPLETLIGELQQKHEGDQQALSLLEGQQREVDLYKKYARWFGSAFLVMQN